MRELWIASGNRKKSIELERLLRPIGFRIRSLAEAPVPVEIVEDGDTFAANAAAKAIPLARAVGQLAIGDDSGLCVEALGGAPGIHSARWAGPDASDRDRIDKLLAELRGVADRRAWFECHVCLAAPDGTVLATFAGRCDGLIRTSPRGADGFGYDPLFVAAAFAGLDPEPTFAELSPDQKDAISHRGLALRRLAAFLSDLDPSAATGAPP